MPKQRRNNFKRQGEMAQLFFRAIAAAAGLQILDPYGDSAPYDVAVENRSGHILKIQVKSTTRPRKGSASFRVELIGPNSKPYTHRQIDFVAVFLVSARVWYIFPFAAIRRGRYTRRYLQIHHFSTKHNQWLPYKNALHLLSQSPKHAESKTIQHLTLKIKQLKADS